MIKLRVAVVLFCIAIILRASKADTVSFTFARVGTSYSAAMFADDPLIGKEVTGARILLNIETYPDSNAANFRTDIALPISPFPGNTRAVVLSGQELGWAGTGFFSHTEETDRFNGTFVASRYGAATYVDGFSGAIIDGRIELDVPEFVRGDFNNDLVADELDIDLLTQQIEAATDARIFDMNQDGQIDSSDRQYWVEEIRHTFFGDSNLDGEFNSADLVTVFQAAEFEDSVKKNSRWSTGDWNGDLDFSSSDLVLAFQSDSYERGPRVVATVPEPSSNLPLILGAIIFRRLRNCPEIPSRWGQ